MAVSAEEAIGQLRSFALMSRKEAKSRIHELVREYSRYVEAYHFAPRRKEVREKLEQIRLKTASLRVHLADLDVAECIALADHEDDLGALRLRAEVAGLLDPETSGSWNIRLLALDELLSARIQHLHSGPQGGRKTVGDAKLRLALEGALLFAECRLEFFGASGHGEFHEFLESLLNLATEGKEGAGASETMLPYAKQALGVHGLSKNHRKRLKEMQKELREAPKDKTKVLKQRYFREIEFVRTSLGGALRSFQPPRGR